MQFREGLRTLPALAAVLALAALVLPAQNQSKGVPKQVPTPPKGVTAGDFFKNVTSSTLKGLAPSDFLGAMGVMSAAVGYDCSDCHPGAGSNSVDWVTDSNPKKVTARRMVEMVAKINRENFGNVQSVTCWTCHHGLDLPTTSIALDKLYGDPNDEKRDVLLAIPGAPPATGILDQYIAAIGGTQRLANIKSYIATGTSEGYSGLGGGGQFQIFAQAPDKRGMWINFPEHPDRGISAWTYDGKAGWISSPRGYFTQYELAGNDLAGARLDGLLSFPGQIKTVFTSWRVSNDDSIQNHDVQVVQGSGAGGLLGTFFFDKKSHLLVRYVRRTPSPVGRITIQQDFDDYRDVDGVKFPFEYSFLWLDGRFSAKIRDVKVNVPIDAAKFNKP